MSDEKTAHRRSPALKILLLGVAMLASVLVAAFGIVLLRAGLDRADKLSSVASMFIGLAGLVGAGISSMRSIRGYEGAVLRNLDEHYWVLEGIKARNPPPEGLVLISGDAVLPNGTTWNWQTESEVGDLLREDWTKCADTLHTLSSPRRLALLHEILSSLKGTEPLPTEIRNSDDLADLEALRRTGWLEISKSGNYRIPGNRVVPLLCVIHAVSLD